MDEPARPDPAFRLPVAGASSRERDIEADAASQVRELDVIQGLAHRATEAGTPQTLFASAAALLCDGERLDLMAVAHALEGRATLACFPARRFAAAFLDALVALGGRLLAGDGEPPVLALRRSETDAYDPGPPARGDFDESQVMVLPLRRRESPVAWLIAVPSAGVDESGLRPLYAASNQISLHLDRILASTEAEADRFRAILESMPQAVLLADDALRVSQGNAAARALIEEAEGGDPIAWLGLESRAREVLRTGKSVALDEVPQGGRLFTVTVSPLAAQGRGGGLVVVLDDVTESRRLRQRLAQSEKMSSLGQMISGVAHELNNPLATILGYSQMLAATATDEKVARRVGALNEEAQRCRRIVESLLSFARRREPESRPVALNEVVVSVEALLARPLGAEAIRFEADLARDLPVVWGDAHQLRQVLVNLVSNAQHAIRGVGRGGTVRVSTRRETSGGACLSVEDSGPGIPQAIRGRIFDPFFTTKPDGQGTGLGLALAYSIVTAHRGGIDVGGSTLGGAVFRITLPPGGPDTTAPDARG